MIHLQTNIITDYENSEGKQEAARLTGEDSCRQAVSELRSGGGKE
jgi:hypothetical protein